MANLCYTNFCAWIFRWYFNVSLLEIFVPRATAFLFNGAFVLLRETSLYLSSTLPRCTRFRQYRVLTFCCGHSVH